MTRRKSHQNSRRTRFALTAALLAAFALVLMVVPIEAAPRAIQIKGTDDMKFSVPKILAKPGEELTISLTSVSSQPKTAMAHNFVLLAQGTEVSKFITAASLARKTEHIPAAFAAKILAKTGLAGGGETVKVTFKAPTTPGTYTYVCSFPGHFTGGMKGELIVK
jgi:azurin